MGQPAARITDMHTCPLVNPGPVPHVGGPIITGAPNVIVGGMPQARITDKCICTGPIDVIVTGAFNVIVAGQPAARIGDKTVHGGVIVTGMPNVLIGMAGGGGGGGGGMAAPATGGPGSGGLETGESGDVGTADATSAAGGTAGSQSAGGPTASLGHGPGGAPAGGGAAPDPSKVGTESYNKSITLEGTPEQRKKIKKDLDDIAATPSGKKMLDHIENSGKKVTIKYSQEKPETTGFTTDGLKNDDGTNGAGSDSTINYDPDRTVYGTEKWMNPIPSGIVLGHELTHSAHLSTGEASLTKVENDSKPDPSDPKKHATVIEEEARTSGFPPYDNEPFSENTLRSEWTPPQPKREYY